MAVVAKQWNGPIGQVDTHEFHFTALAAGTVQLFPIQDKNYKVIDAWVVNEELSPATASVTLKNDTTTIGTITLNAVADKIITRIADIDTAQYEITTADALNATLVDAVSHTFKLFVKTMIVAN